MHPDKQVGFEEVSIPKRVSEALKLSSTLDGARLKIIVSIPKRVSEALKLASALISALRSIVSIPKRVSEALKQT